MKKIKPLTKLQILKETKDYYSEDPKRRAATKTRCKYATNDGRYCAVGRCFILPELIEEALDGKAINICSLISMNMGEDNFQENLHPQYRGHGSAFWLDLQGFHDDNDYWSSIGLTEAGEEEYERLVNMYK